MSAGMAGLKVVVVRQLISYGRSLGAGNRSMRFGPLEKPGPGA